MGCVYFIRHKGTNPIKIGHTSKNNPDDRIKEFEVGSPFGIELMGVILCKHSADMEHTIHDMFKDRNIKGEWYNIDKEDVDDVVRIFSYDNISQLNVLRGICITYQITPAKLIDIVKKYEKNTSVTDKAGCIIPSLSDLPNNDGWCEKQHFIDKMVEINNKGIATIYRYWREFMKDNYEIRKEGKKVFIKEMN